jgi:molybdopterin converting factor small subunit
VAGQVTLRYWAGARAAAGVREDVFDVAGPVTLGELVTRALAAHPDAPRLADVLAMCAVLVAERPVTTADPATTEVRPGQSVEFLPPFAGG